MILNKRKAFTMIELIFVIVILGILSSIAISKLAVTRDDAMITKGRSDVAAIRNAIALAKSIQMMEGNMTLYPSSLDNGGGKLFDTSSNGIKLLDYPIYPKDADGHWRKVGNNVYAYKVMKTDVRFVYDPNTGVFDCHGQNSGVADTYCKNLTE